MQDRIDSSRTNHFTLCVEILILLVAASAAATIQLGLDILS